jgi:hypothetical protein
MKCESQSQLEDLYHKHNANSFLYSEFAEAGFEQALEKLEIPVKFGMDMLIQLSLHKRANVPTLVGILRKHFLDEQHPGEVCASWLYKAAKADLIDWEDISQCFVVKYRLSADAQRRFDTYQYPLPMISEPMPVTHNHATGYQTIEGSIILKDNHHNDDVCLDHINRVNAIPLSLNTDVVAFVQNKWKSLDSKKVDETQEEFIKRKRAFAKFNENSREVIAGLLTMGDRFWLTHKYDKRGRTYSQGYHVNYQGNDWCKAVVQFADPEPLNQE